MQIHRSIPDFRAWRQSLPASTRTPFVPTMGALHEGHLSLIREARVLAGSAGKVTASIFVNPTQFGPAEDFTKYPRALEGDLALLQSAGCDVVFVPAAAEMYPSLRAPNTLGLVESMSISPGPLADVLEGSVRPGHFRGVCTVVAKLLHIVEPTDLLLGQKDFQQQAILRRMCDDLNMNVSVITCATVREADGLAMSSRNQYLNVEDRSRAGGIFEAMEQSRRLFCTGERRAAVLEETMRNILATRGLETQYAVVVHPDTLELWSARAPGTIDGNAVLLVAAKVKGGTRLIDNLRLSVEVGG